jgi:hypothetical protein
MIMMIHLVVMMMKMIVMMMMDVIEIDEEKSEMI